MNKELSPGFHLVDAFSDCFSFNIVKHKDTRARATHLNYLENIYQRSHLKPDTVFVISDTSIHNNIATYYKRSLTCFCDGLNIDSKSL